MLNITSGIHLQKAIGQTYTIHIPHRHTLGAAVPLVVLLHWGGKKHRFIGREILEFLGVPAFSSMQAVIVAPDRKRRHWAVPKAISDLEKLVQYLERNLNLIPNQRLVAGYSDGGVGVWFTGAENPKLFSCGISMAAPIPDEIVDENWDFPIYSIHGQLDELVPFDINHDRARLLKEQGVPIEFVGVDKTMHADVRNYIPALSNSVRWVEGIWAD